MNFKTTISKKQVTAFFLLAVFLFIQVVKTLHTHESVSEGHASSEIEQVQKSPDCFVCEYHLAKDADVQTAVIKSEITIAYITAIVFIKSRTTSSIGLTYADRGPPTLA